MNERSGAYRPSASWEDLAPPRLMGDGERTPPLVPWGLVDDEPAADARLGAELDDDVYLCVRCWEWHGGSRCPDRPR